MHLEALRCHKLRAPAGQPWLGTVRRTRRHRFNRVTGWRYPITRLDLASVAEKSTTSQESPARWSSVRLRSAKWECNAEELKQRRIHLHAAMQKMARLEHRRQCPAG